jgi:hypothetical protein
MPSFPLTSATNNSHALCAITLRKDAAEFWDGPTASGPGHFGDPTPGSNYSATSPTWTLATGGYTLGVTALNDVAFSSAPGGTTTGDIVLGTRTERYDNSTATGNDVSLVVGDAPVTTGGTGTITRTASLTTTSGGTTAMSTQGGTNWIQQTASVWGTVLTETWTGTTGAAWPTPWTLVGGPGTATIQANRGAITVTGAPGTGTGAIGMYYPESRADTDVTVLWRVSSITMAFVNVQVRASATKATEGAGDYSSVGYLLQPNIGSTTTLYIWRVSGGVAALGTSATITVAANTDYRFRLRASGGLVQAKFWAASATEPAAWTLTYGDPNPLPAGGFWLGARNGSAGTDNGYRFDDMTVLASGAAAVASSMPLAPTSYARFLPILAR